MARCSIACLLMWCTLARAYMLDTYSGDLAHMQAPASCVYGCAVWSNVASSFSSYTQAEVDALWASRSAQASAGSSCALPANIGVPEGAMCVCAGASASARVRSMGTCTEALIPQPQQVNLQFGATGAELQVAFVTVDRGVPLVRPPLVELCPLEGACSNHTGHVTRAPEPQDVSRVLSYSFVPLLTHALVPHASFTYRALPGTSVAAWSETLRFTVPARDDSGDPFRFALFGDQGLFPYSSIGNLVDDVNHGRIDAVVHLGDLAYNLAMANGSRGDGYMYALQPVLSAVPWIAVIGNHELEGSPFGSYCNSSTYCEGRFLNQTAGQLVAGAASGSNTSLYFSINVGLVHFVILSAMPYLGLGSHDVRAAQTAWLKRDLATASAPAAREAVPWILVLTHVPLYCSSINANTAYGDVSPPPPYAGCLADGVDVGDAIRADWEPSLIASGVDLVAYGHVHVYESMWPVGPNGAVPKRSFDAPSAPVHVLTGAGGPPGRADDFSQPGPATRFTFREWSYGRVTVHNASALTYEHILNTDGSVVDAWTIVQPAHGPFCAVA